MGENFSIYVTELQRFYRTNFMKRVERRYEMSFALFCDATSCIISFFSESEGLKKPFQSKNETNSSPAVPLPLSMAAPRSYAEESRVIIPLRSISAFRLPQDANMPIFLVIKPVIVFRLSKRNSSILFVCRISLKLVFDVRHAKDIIYTICYHLGFYE